MPDEGASGCDVGGDGVEVEELPVCGADWVVVGVVVDGWVVDATVGWLAAGFPFRYAAAGNLGLSQVDVLVTKLA